MKHYFVKTAALAAFTMFSQRAVFAQEQKVESPNREEIIIQRKGDKDGRVVIELKGGQLLVNGKPVEEFEDENLSIKKRQALDGEGDFMIRGMPNSPFRKDELIVGDGARYSTRSNRAFLGVAAVKSKEAGALVDQVTQGSAAEKIGLKKGDIITRVDEISIAGPDDLVSAIGKYKAGAKVQVTSKRDGKEQKATAELGLAKTELRNYRYFRAPEMRDEDFNLVMPPMASMVPDDMLSPPARPFIFPYNMNGPRIGIRAQDTEEGKGVKVLAVDKDSPAEKAGIKAGDIVTDMDGKPVSSAGQLAELARADRSKSAFKIKLLRDRKPLEIEIKIPKNLKTADL